MAPARRGNQGDPEPPPPPSMAEVVMAIEEIGRASCRERVYVLV